MESGSRLKSSPSQGTTPVVSIALVPLKDSRQEQLRLRELLQDKQIDIFTIGGNTVHPVVSIALVALLDSRPEQLRSSNTNTGLHHQEQPLYLEIQSCLYHSKNLPNSRHLGGGAKDANAIKTLTIG